MPSSEKVLCCRRDEVVGAEGVVGEAASLVLYLILDVSLFTRDENVAFRIRGRALASILGGVRGTNRGGVLFTCRTASRCRMATGVRTGQRGRTLRVILRKGPFSFMRRGACFTIRCANGAAQIRRVGNHIISRRRRPLPFTGIILVSSIDGTCITNYMATRSKDFILPCTSGSIVLGISFINCGSRALIYGPAVRVNLRPSARRLGTMAVGDAHPGIICGSKTFSALMSNAVLNRLNSTRSVVDRLPFISNRTND